MERKLNPIMDASRVYQKEECARTFDIDLILHLKHGYVFSTPEAFMMIRPVRTDSDYEKITDPEYNYEEPDAWLVYLAAGDLKMLWKYEPWPLPMIGFERENEIRFYKRERFKELCETMTQMSKS